MKTFSGERLKKIELAIRKSPLSRKLLAATGALAIAAPIAGCAEQGTSTPDKPVESSSPNTSKGYSQSGTPKPETSSEPTPVRDSSHMPETSSIVVTEESLEDIQRELQDVPGGFREKAEELPVLGSDIDLEGLEDNCQEEANQNFANDLKVEDGSTDPEVSANAGIVGITHFFNEDGYYSIYNCLSDDAQDMYGDALTQQFK